MKLIINSRESLTLAQSEIAAEWERAKYLRIDIKTGKDRSLSQNAISHAWYTQIAEELREQTVLGVKCECKLTIGVPILRAENAEFRSIYDASIRPLTYERKLDVMKILPVTSVMLVSQLSQYLGEMQRIYAERGVKLEFPPEDA